MAAGRVDALERQVADGDASAFGELASDRARLDVVAGRVDAAALRDRDARPVLVARPPEL